MPHPTVDQLPGFPPEARRVFESLLSLDLQPVSTLERGVDRHLADLEEAHGRNEFLDLATASELAGAARRLLDVAPQSSEGDQRLIQAAVLYFVVDNDASPDTRALMGLEDDAEVLRAVATYLEAR